MYKQTYITIKIIIYIIHIYIYIYYFRRYVTLGRPPPPTPGPLSQSVTPWPTPPPLERYVIVENKIEQNMEWNEKEELKGLLAANKRKPVISEKKEKK